MTDGRMQSTGPRLGGAAAAAILLTVLGDEEAATILGSLNPDEARRLGVAMLNVAHSTAGDVEVALDLFVSRSRATAGLGLDACDRVRSVFSSALGARAGGILADIAPTGADALVHKLRWAGVDAISAMLSAEHPQAGALILACLPPETAAEAIQSLDEERQSDLLYRAAGLDGVTAEALAELEHVVDGYSVGTRAGTIRLSGLSEVAKIVNHLPEGVPVRILKNLKKRNKLLGRQIEDEMLVFDDLRALDAKAMSTLLRSIDAQVLTLALRGAAPETVDTMLGCLSARAADTIRDELADGAAVKRVDVEIARKDVASVARDLIASGEISLGSRKGDYV